MKVTYIFMRHGANFNLAWMSLLRMKVDKSTSQA